MTGPNREENTLAEMQRAEQTLLAAEALLGLGMWNDAVSRAYYVAFHAACALSSASASRRAPTAVFTA